jgi:hypothetical protein
MDTPRKPIPNLKKTRIHNHNNTFDAEIIKRGFALKFIKDSFGNNLKVGCLDLSRALDPKTLQNSTENLYSLRLARAPTTIKDNLNENRRFMGMHEAKRD